MNKIIQQGDVIMKQISALPDGERTHDKQTREKILAFGEVTGHAHRLADQANTAKVVRVMGQLYMIIAEATELTHEEHNTIVVPPGTYQVDIVREADHMAGIIRQVAD